MTTDMLAVRRFFAATMTRSPKPMSAREEDLERDARIARWIALHRRLHHEEPEPEPIPYTDENDEKEDVT